MIHTEREFKVPAFTETVCWSGSKVRDCCIENNLYTCGDNADYSKMLVFVCTVPYSNANLYRVALDICEHSKDQTVENIMYLLRNSAVWSFFDFDIEED